MTVHSHFIKLLGFSYYAKVVGCADLILDFIYILDRRGKFQTDLFFLVSSQYDVNYHQSIR